jgi:hypothetical protein
MKVLLDLGFPADEHLCEEMLAKFAGIKPEKKEPIE